MGHTGAMRDLGEHSTKIEFGAALSLSFIITTTATAAAVGLAQHVVCLCSVSTMTQEKRIRKYSLLVLTTIALCHVQTIARYVRFLPLSWHCLDRGWLSALDRRWRFFSS